MKLERLKKYCVRSEPGFLGFGEVSTKEQVQSNPSHEPLRAAASPSPRQTRTSNSLYEYIRFWGIMPFRPLSWAKGVCREATSDISQTRQCLVTRPNEFVLKGRWTGRAVALLQLFRTWDRLSHGERLPSRLERLKQYCGHSQRGFLRFGVAPAKEQVHSNPVTEPKQSQNPKRPFPSSVQPDGYSIPFNALNTLNVMLRLPMSLLLLAATGCASHGYRLVWHDEFNHNGRPNPANWTCENGFERNHELQWYQPDNAVCTNGMLVIEARREQKPNPNYSPDSMRWQTSRKDIECTSALLSTRGLREFTYGKFEMRARIDTQPGSWPAFWTLGATPHIGWPACGEIDIMEFYQGAVLANFGYGRNHQTKWLACKQPVAQFGDENWAKRFHLWTMEWDPQKIDLLLDGRLMNHLDVASADHADQGNPFRRPAYIILNQAIGGDSGGDPSNSTFPIRFEVDWVRVYQRDQP